MEPEPPFNQRGAGRSAVKPIADYRKTGICQVKADLVPAATVRVGRYQRDVAKVAQRLHLGKGRASRSTVPRA